MLENINIQKINRSNLKKLQVISTQTFYETFANENSEEDMNKYLAENLNEQKLTAELTNPNSVFYFATLNNEVIGYLKLNFKDAQTEKNDEDSVEIERIYVLKAYHGKQVGQGLFNTALKIAKQHKASYVWLGVWEKNVRAINFYIKNGFIKFDTHVFKLGNDEQTDILMRLKIN
jgi:diamine N-acetyltransferase